MPRSLTRRAFVVLASSAALLPRLALADAPKDNGAPDRAFPFVASQTGALPGGSGGRFAYYKFDSPGGWPVRINLDPGTADKVVLRAVGFKVYGPDPNRVYVEGKLDDNATWQGGTDLSSPDQGTYLIQVYNYNPNADTVLNFTLGGINVPAQPGQPGAAASQQPDEGAFGYTAIPLVGVKQGALEAGSAGRFRYYKFKAAAGSTISVDMRIEPDDAGILKTAGFKLYGPQQGREYLQSESRKGQTPNATGNLYVPDNGMYILQVYNYSPNTPITYRLSTRGQTWVD